MKNANILEIFTIAIIQNTDKHISEIFASVLNKL